MTPFELATEVYNGAFCRMQEPDEHMILFHLAAWLNKLIKDNPETTVDDCFMDMVKFKKLHHLEG